MDSGAILDLSYQRYWKRDNREKTIKLSPKEDMLAFPDFQNDVSSTVYPIKSFVWLILSERQFLKVLH